MRRRIKMGRRRGNTQKLRLALALLMSLLIPAIESGSGSLAGESMRVQAAEQIIADSVGYNAAEAAKAGTAPDIQSGAKADTAWGVQPRAGEDMVTDVRPRAGEDMVTDAQPGEAEDTVIDAQPGAKAGAAPDARPGTGSDTVRTENGDSMAFIQEIEEIDPAEITVGTASGQGGPEDLGEGDGIGAGDDKTENPELSSEAESDTETEEESGTESETGDASRPGDGNADQTGGDGSDTDKTEEKVYLGIDNLHIYDGMEQSFSDGYRPTVRDGSLELVIPYEASGKLREDRLTVDLEFPQQQEAPCELKNYQKDVEKRFYRLSDGVMKEDNSAREGSGEEGAAGAADCTETYLYQCRIPVLASAQPGQYSVTVKARGYTEEMDPVKLDYQIFFQIPEPEPGPAAKQAKENKAGSTLAGGSGYGGGGSGGYGGDGAAAEEVIRQPKMLLKDCNLVGRELEAGSREEMRVSFQNCSQSQTMYNLKVVMQTESTAVAAQRNSFYFEKVEPEETIHIEEAITVEEGAEAGAIPVAFSFEYEDKAGTAASGTETMNLTVVQPVKMELESTGIPAQVYASDTITVPVTVLNLSRTEAYNARVHLEGTGLFPTGDVFIGNMEAGSSGDGSMKIYVGTRTMEAIGMETGTEDGEKYGAVGGTLTLAYEDASGKTHEITQEYQTEIKKAQILSLNVEEESPEGNSWWISIFAVVILGLCVLILLLIMRLRRKSVLLEEARKTGAGVPG